MFESVAGHVLYWMFSAIYVVAMLLPLLCLVGGVLLATLGVRWFMRSTRPLVIDPTMFVELPVAHLVARARTDAKGR